MPIDINYHQRQYDQIYRSTSRLLELVDECASPAPGDHLLDVCCGGGANCCHMMSRWPGVRVTGIDLDGELLDFARSRLSPEASQRCTYEQADLFDLPKRFPPRAFTFATWMQTLLLFGPDDYPGTLASILPVVDRWLFLSSLFTEKSMDIAAHIRDYARFGEDTREEIPYNVLSMSRFERVCRGLGVKEVVFRDFWIDIDLPAPADGGIGTYTVPLRDDRRLQFSGAMYMPWKFAALRVG